MSPSPRTAVLALVSGLSSRDRANRDLAMLQCFVDDSGHNNGPVLVLAGFIASVDTWLEFSDDWQAVLDLPPRFDYLRMREAWGGKYPRWSIPERDDRLRKFYDVIAEHAVGAIRVAVPREPYKRIFGHVREWKSCYQYALFHLIKGYRSNHMKIGLERNVTFIFDIEQHAKRRIERAWRFFKAEGNEHLSAIMGGLPKFEDDKKVKPLQAADLFAWASRRQYASHIEGNDMPQFPWNRKDGIPTLDYFCTEESLRRATEDIFAPATPQELLRLRRYRGF